MTHLSPETLAAVDAAVHRLLPAHLRLLEALVREPSTIGAESGAQDLLVAPLEALGFAPRRIPLDDALADAPGGGRPIVPAGGRNALVGERDGDSPAALVLNGHVDVVPAEDDDLWSSPPFVPREQDGWLHGRGAGDMKGGIVMALLALAALAEAAPGASEGRIAFALVPEEECTGNGTLATIRAGVGGDVAILPEPTDLQLLVSGVGVAWCELVVRGRPAHAGSAETGVNPIDRLLLLVEALRALGARLEAEHAAGPLGGDRYNVNLGTLRAGDWPSSVPTSARAVLRLGYPSGLDPSAFEERVRAAIAEAAAADPWLAGSPPRVRFTGFRAEPHELALDHPLIGAVRAAHRDAHGADPGIVRGSATSDARLYLNQGGIPALCYGPRTRAIHGIDEAVEIASIVDGARTLVRLVPALLAGAGTGRRAS